jgi:copper transport protein
VPARGAALEAAPAQVEFRFSETVQAGVAAVRVFDGHGKEVQQGEATHPGGEGSVVAVKVPRDLPDGGYTATYRVISADSHPVSGGFSFTVGTGGAGPQSVDTLLAGTASGAVTATAMGAARAVEYAAIAVALGIALFVLLCWRPALHELTGGDAAGGGGVPWRDASAAFAARLRGIVLLVAVAGAVASVLGVLLEGAIARGTSLWSALGSDVVRQILGTRFGTVWGLAVLAWLLVAIASRTRKPILVAVPLAFLCALPALGGHAGVEHPVWLFLPANLVHVLSVSAWIGGLAVLTFALRAATGALDPADRSRLLAATVGRFSAMAGVAVAAILATGIIQSLIEIDAWSELLHTAYGRAVLIKLGLFAVLLAFGAVNRLRVLPRLRGAAAAAQSPGAVGTLLRRTVRTELLVGVAVLGVTGALATYAPGKVAETGPVTADAVIGPARMQLTVDPARPGVNEIHAYFFDRKTGAQWTAAKELTVTASLPARGIADLPVAMNHAGPGHYVAQQTALPATGNWRVKVAARVSDFDEYQATVTVRIR